MNSNSPSRAWKRKVLAAVGFVCLLDLGLVIFRVQLEKTPESQLLARQKTLEREAKLLNDDVQSALAIRQHMADVGRQAERFYQEILLPSSTGYSALDGDLSRIVSMAGVRASTISFKPKEIKEHGVTRVEISTQVEGDYSQLIRLIDALVRSRNFYMLNRLALDSGSAGGIRLQLELTTYLRT